MMKLLVIFASVLLAVIVPTSGSFRFSQGDILAVDDEFFEEDQIIYRAEYDVVDIVLPLNLLNKDLHTLHNLIFFVLADLSDGKRVDKGLYVRKDGIAKKLLDSARVSAAARDRTSEAYFGTKNGLYHYNAFTNTAEKYGNFDESIISMVKANNNDTLYVLTENYVLYKVTDNGTKKEIIDKVANVRDIEIDIDNNLYVQTAEKTVHILGKKGIKKVDGLVENPTYLKMFKSPFFVKDSIALIANNMSHLVFANGTVGVGHCEYFVKPTAYSMQPLLLQHYGYNKNIYELSFLKKFPTRVTTAVNRMVRYQFNGVLSYLNIIKRFVKD